MRLYHFSDNPDLDLFVPRPVRVPSQRPSGFEWLNGPLVWAIEENYQAMYLFPRECPRILMWRTSETIEEDYTYWWKGSTAKVIVYIEKVWFERVSSECIYRYEMPSDLFESINDAGMWVSKLKVKPIKLDVLTDLRQEQVKSNVELRVLDDLLPLKGLWQTTLHASGIRLRNAQNW